MEHNKDVIDSQLPSGYDVIDTYQTQHEQVLVDNLFDYFGRAYYQQDDNLDVKKIRNKAISKHDEKLFYYINSKIKLFSWLTAFFLILTAISYFLFYFFVGSSIEKVQDLSLTLSTQTIVDYDTWNVLFLAIFVLINFFALITVVMFGFVIGWYAKNQCEVKRISSKVNDWNKNFVKFTSNLSQGGIYNSIQSSITDLVFAKNTPLFDRHTHTLHSRFFPYGKIPHDAKEVSFKNLNSGFYKGNQFKLSYSSWEWFREAKIIEQNTHGEGKVTITTKRSLKRYEDELCILEIETFAQPNLNFVLNNADGANIRMPNAIFNKVFSLAVSNPKLAYTVFTPYVQHTLLRCKTWSPAAKAIRQIVKEGSKIYVIFDGRHDFLTFEKIFDLNLNHMFIDEENCLPQQPLNLKTYRLKHKRVHFGSLDKTMSLMTEFILNDLNLFYSVLEMGSCYPLDDAFNANKKNNVLSNLLEKKQIVPMRSNDLNLNLNK